MYISLIVVVIVYAIVRTILQSLYRSAPSLEKETNLRDTVIIYDFLGGFYFLASLAAISLGVDDAGLRFGAMAIFSVISIFIVIVSMEGMDTTAPANNEYRRFP